MSYVKNLSAWETQNTSIVDMLFQFTSKKTNQSMEVIGHILDALTSVWFSLSELKQHVYYPGIMGLPSIELVHGLMSKWKVLEVIVKIDGENRGTTVGTWVLVGKIEIFGIFFCLG